MSRRIGLLLLGLTGTASSLRACDLCAIYNANNARSSRSAVFGLTVAEQYVPYNTPSLDGREVSVADPDALNESITHLVPGFNISPRFGVGLNVPVVHRTFRRTALEVAPDHSTRIVQESGTVFGLGDVSLVGRLTVLELSEMNRGLSLNLLAGVKVPTGDSDRLEDEVVHARRYDALLGPGHPHDVLGLPVGGVHQHDLSLGAGSFDGVFGVTVNSRWSRWFVRGEAQYYLRTEGTAGFEYGDELILSGGPGVYLYSDRSLTFSVQGNVVFDREARAALDGRESNHTGMTACYVGPQIFLTWGRHLTANAGIDVPVAIDHRGYQNVPDWRLHFGFTWWF